MANKPSEDNFFPDVPEFPSIGTFQPVYGKFDLTTYIQGASDYEIMAFLVGKYNACLEAYGNITKLSTDTITACKQLQDWINSWFTNLDVQEEINKKLDKMVADSSFGTLLHQTFDAQINQQTTSAVTAWLVANVTPTGSAVIVDKSLSINSAAANSRSVGAITGEQLFKFEKGTINSTPVGEIADLTVNTVPFWEHSVIELTQGTYYIKCNNGTLVSGLMFLDKDKRVLYNTAGTEGKAYSKVFYAPAGTQYAVVNANTDKPGCVTTGILIDIESLLIGTGYNTNLLNPVEYGKIEIGDIGSTVTFDVSIANGYHKIIRVQPGDQFVYSVAKATGDLCFCDAELKIISNIAKTNAGIFYSIAPKNAKYLVCNYSIQNSFINRLVDDASINTNYKSIETAKTSKDCNNDNLFTRTFKVGAYIIGNVGEKFDANNALNYNPQNMCVYIRCHKESLIYLNVNAPSNYTCVAFLDTDYNVIYKAPKSAYYNEILTIPSNAEFVIVNSATTTGTAEFINSTSVYQGVNKKSFEFANFNISAPESFYSMQNGKNFSNDINGSIVASFGKPEDKMVHVGTTIKINNVYYCTFYANTVTNIEEPKYHVARFATYSKNNYTYYDILRAGDTFDGHIITGIYDTVLMTIDNNTLFINIATQLDGKYYRLYQTFNIATKMFGNIGYCNIDGNTWNEQNFNSLLPTTHKTTHDDIGLMATLSPRTENGKTLYYTGAYWGDFNCIVKTENLIDWLYVSQPPHFLPTQFENAVYCLGDTVYFYTRCNHNVNYDLLLSYNLNTKQWTPILKIPDCHSRGCFMYYNNELYLAHAPYSRDCIELIKIDANNPVESRAYATGVRYGSFYPYLNVNSDGSVIMTYTEERLHIRVCELHLPYKNFISAYKEVYS